MRKKLSSANFYEFLATLLHIVSLIIFYFHYCVITYSWFVPVIVYATYFSQLMHIRSNGWMKWLLLLLWRVWNVFTNSLISNSVNLGCLLWLTSTTVCRQNTNKNVFFILELVCIKYQSVKYLPGVKHFKRTSKHTVWKIFVEKCNTLFQCYNIVI